MNRSEVFRLIKRKIRRFCESPLEPSAAEARSLIWQLNELVDEVTTVESPTLDRLKREAFDRLISLGVLIRCCSVCKLPLFDCRCARKSETYVTLNHSVIKELGIV